MFGSLSTFFLASLKVGAVLMVFNEIRGLILAAPIIYGMYMSGGSLMALWLGFSSLAGIALSVVLPIMAAKRINRLVAARAG